MNNAVKIIIKSIVFIVCLGLILWGRKISVLQVWLWN